MEYTQADYERERAICDKAFAYAQQFRQPNGWTVIPGDAELHPDYAACDNAMRGRVERFEILRDIPDKFTAYLESGKPDGIGSRLAVTCWPGDLLGYAVVNSIGPRRGWACERQRYGRAWINGREYAWQGPGSGCYVHLRAIKNKTRKS